MAKAAAPKRMTPLHVIALLLGVAEVAMTFAATQTTGDVQVGFTVFAIGFPILTAVGFFLMLWNRPQNLYPPSEYGTTDVATFAAAMQQRQNGVAVGIEAFTLTRLVAQHPDGAPEPAALEAAEARSADEVIAGMDDPFCAELETHVSRFLVEQRGIVSDEQTLRVLRRAHAQALMTADFERIFGVIFGSQVALLERANVHSVLVRDEEEQFARIQAQEPLFADATFDFFTSYLRVNALIEDEEGNPPALALTQKGRSFLHFLIGARKPRRAL